MRSIVSSTAKMCYYINSIIRHGNYTNLLPPLSVKLVDMGVGLNYSIFFTYICRLFWVS